MFAPKTVIEGLRGVGRVELVVEKGRSAYVFLGRNAVGKTKALEALFQVALFSYIRGSELWKEFPLPPIPRDLAVFEAVHGGSWTIGSAIHAGIPDVQAIAGASPHEITPPVFAGSQNRGFFRCTKGRARKLGTARQRGHEYIRSQLMEMSTNFTSLNMGGDIESWFVTRAQSSNRYQSLSDSREIEIETVLKLMNQIDSRIDSNFLQVSGDEKVSVKLAGEIRQLDQLSSGFASLLKLVQTIVAGYASYTNERALSQVHGTVFIDEIESHLHLTWQARIVRQLVELFPNTVFYVTTHSALVTAQCRTGEAYSLERDEDGVVRSHPIGSPGTSAFVDLLDDVFGVDVNALKIDRMNPEDQKRTKVALLQLLRSKGN